MINKRFIDEVINLVEKLELGSTIQIKKENETDVYKVQRDEFEDIELVSLCKKDTIWNSYDNIEDMKKDLICDAVRGNFESCVLF
jgi:hypothetical protein